MPLPPSEERTDDDISIFSGQNVNASDRCLSPDAFCQVGGNAVHLFGAWAYTPTAVSGIGGVAKKLFSKMDGCSRSTATLNWRCHSTY